MKAILGLALAAGLTLAACDTVPSPDRIPDGPSIGGGPSASPFMVPGTLGAGAWVRLCMTELRYKNFTMPYGYSGFADDPSGAGHFFALTKSGIIMSPSSTPVNVPTSEWYDAVETPDLWLFLQEAADDGKWVEFFAWAPDVAGVRRVTQARRQYPSGESAACPTP